MPFGVGNGNISPLALASVSGIPAALLYLKMKHPLLWHDLRMQKRRSDISHKLELVKLSGQTIVDIFEKHAKRNPNKACVLFENERYTYQDVNRRADDLARWVWGKYRLPRGDVVAVLMHNEPAFAWMWLGFAKLGVITSLLNTNLKLDSLVYCIKACNAKFLLCGSEFLPILHKIMPELNELGVDVWLIGNTQQVDDIPEGVVVMDTTETEGLPTPRAKVTQEDMATYIYTSGTTGLPKASRIGFFRLFKVSELTSVHSPFNANDTVYTALPLYHSAGLMVGMLSIFLAGGTLAIARKFSASKYWDDVRRHKATIVQYIGELCRYMLAQPERPNDGKYSHKVRMAVGNGLQPEIWENFKTRFNVEYIAEFYGATELGKAFLNTDGKPGVVGRYPWISKIMVGDTELVECDHTSGELVRGSDGKCISVPNGKPGLLLLKLGDKLKFEGYVAPPEVNERKIARNVNADGDMYFNTGDLLMLDADGYLHFKDRLGDTFRWKGENVSTLEVSQVFCQLPDVFEVNVYGVEVPGHEGRAGMAAIVMRDGKSLDIDALYRRVTENLPNYACPRFIRLMPAMPVTSTFKHRKADLVRQGFDPKLVDDPLYVLDERQKTYMPLDMPRLNALLAGRSKL